MTELREGLASLAAQMRPVDVYDGVIRRSRRARDRQRAFGALAGGVVIAGAVWVANTYLPGPTPLDPAPDPSASPSAHASPSPTPSPSAEPTSAPTTGTGEVDLRNATLEIVIPVGRGTAKIVNGTGTVDINVRYNVTIMSAANLDGGYSVALVQIKETNGSPLRTVHIYQIAAGVPVNPTVLGNDNVGLFYDATKVVADGERFVVTVAGAQWVFEQDPRTKEWKRVN